MTAMGASDRQVIEQMTAAWNRRDPDTLLALVASDVEYVNAPIAVEPGTRHGRAAFASVVRKQWEALGEDARQKLEAIERSGDDVVATVRISRTMPGSALRIENRVALRWTIHDGVVRRLEVIGTVG